jgi:catechol 2,3-dioxygenase-like lactoylglutathione lyase family enzyme
MSRRRRQDGTPTTSDCDDDGVFGPPVQLAYVVDDPHDAARQWEERFGAGPFVVREHIEVTDVVHRGSPSVFDHTSAYGWWGATMIELFCQHGDAPSAVSERFTPGSGGLHHVACFVDDLDEALARVDAAGLELAMTARAGNTRFVFVDDVAARGHYWELYEGTDHLRAFYAHIEALHRAR